MPYIDKNLREQLDPHIDQLAMAIEGCTSDSSFPGVLNYCCTRLALGIVKHHRGRMKYYTLALIVGVFQTLVFEFYRRVGAPLETQAAVRNGDLPEFQQEFQQSED